MKSVYESIMTGSNEAIEDEKTEDKKLSRRQVTSMCELFDQYTRRGREEGMRGIIITCKEFNINYDDTMLKLRKNLNITESEAIECRKFPFRSSEGESNRGSFIGKKILTFISYYAKNILYLLEQ